MAKKNIDITIEGVEMDDLPDNIESDLDEMLYRRIAEDYDADPDDVTVEITDR